VLAGEPRYALAAGLAHLAREPHAINDLCRHALIPSALSIPSDPGKIAAGTSRRLSTGARCEIIDCSDPDSESSFSMRARAAEFP
jgi:hypothetical protein